MEIGEIVMINVNNLVVGNRFNIYSSEQEICDISCGNVRYASVIGGKMCTIPLNKFQNLINQKVIVDLDTSSNEISPKDLNDDEVKEMNRRLSYIRPVIAKAFYPVSKKECKPIISETAITIGDKKKPSFSTYARWYKLFIKSGNNPLSLVPGNRSMGNRYNRFDPIIEKIISEHIIKDWLEEQRPTISTVFANITADIVDQYAINDQLPHDVKFPSRSVIERRIKSIDPFLRDTRRKGKRFANKKYRAAGKGLITTRILEVAQADGNYIDVLIIDENSKEVVGRAYLTLIMDVYSRCIIGYKLSFIPFSSATLLETIKNAVTGKQTGFGGVFEKIIFDNGSDYISFSVKNLCNVLGVTIEHGAPYDPNTKAFVERLFKTMNMQLFHLIPGTTFSNTQEKGDYDSEKMTCMTLHEIEELISDWIQNIYHKSIHGGTGRAPELLWRDSEKENPVFTYDEDSLDVIAREVIKADISNGRVRHKYLHWYSHALATLEEKLRQQNSSTKVEVYINTLNLGKVYVKDPDNRGVFITCVSTNPDYTKNLTMYEHKKVLEDKKLQADKDISSYSNKELEVAKWELWKKINKAGSKFARKQIARIKNSNKKTKTEMEVLQSQSLNVTKSIAVNSKKKETKRLLATLVETNSDQLIEENENEVNHTESENNNIKFTYERL